MLQSLNRERGNEGAGCERRLTGHNKYVYLPNSPQSHIPITSANMTCLHVCVTLCPEACKEGNGCGLPEHYGHDGSDDGRDECERGRDGQQGLHWDSQ